MQVSSFTGATVLDMLNSNDVAGAARDFLRPRFWDDVKVATLPGHGEYENNQIIIVLSDKTSKECPDHEHHKKFRQIMEYLAFEPTWYAKSRTSIEMTFEGALVDNKLCFPILRSEKRAYIKRPPENVRALENFGGKREGRIEQSEYLKRWQTCYKQVEDWLRIKHPNNHLWSKMGPLSEDQQHLEHYFDLCTGGPSQRIKKAIDFAVSQSQKVGKRKPTLGVRFDTVYPPAEHKIMISEIKPTAAISVNGLIHRVAQLSAYDAWLSYTQDDETPLAYVLPTVNSHLECIMVEQVSETRPVIPICITTNSFLKQDIKFRKRISKYVIENQQMTGEGMKIDPQVAERHSNELEHLQGLESVLYNLGILV